MRRILLVCAVAATAHGAPVDRGIFSDLDAAVPIEVAAPARDGAARLLVDEPRGLATLYVGGDPIALYAYPLSAGVRAQLEARAVTEVRGAPARGEDRDGDGIVDRLDILRGAKKLLVNKAAYRERYVGLRYPGGDVPRTEGVCTDTVVRALRNAGIDLQREVHEDLVAARRAYPMVDKVDPNINHRRVKTLIAWFKRHFTTLPAGGDYQPGDIVFFDTFPQKAGAEHVGVVSDRRDRAGQLLVINNWTDGAVDAEMALLGAIPVTDHFRAGAPAR